MNTMNEDTPIFDALIATLGDPVPVPAIDRSYPTLVAMALNPTASVPAPASPRKAVAAAGRKSAR
ncbi:hypothetical protein GCM10009547_10470 [Sporichthya brevicatena]|uniref:Uncharacterized protein n=2 Tax=Sporichthya brevicatena TaxID=171442 RepID=A0ABN1GFD2_9ACTN